MLIDFHNCASWSPFSICYLPTFVFFPFFPALGLLARLGTLMLFLIFLLFFELAFGLFFWIVVDING